MSIPHLRQNKNTFWLIALCVGVGLAIGAISIAVNPLYLVAGAVAAPVALWLLGNLNRISLAFVVVIGLLPRFTSPVRLGGFTPTALDAVLIGLIAVWFFTARSRLPLRRSAIGVPLICLIVVAVTTFLVGLPNGALTPLVARRFAELVLSLLAVWVLVAILPNLQTQLHFSRLLIGVGSLSALVGIVLYFLPDELVMRMLSALRPFGYPEGPGVLRFIRDDPTLAQRATGLWIDPNAYGGFLLLVGAITLPHIFAHAPKGQRVLPRLWLALGMGLIGLALVLTVSRGAMLGLAFAAGLMGLLRYRRLLLVGLLVVGAILVLPQTRSLVQHFAEGFAGQDLATQMRFGEYKDALRLIERYPLLGVGFIDAPDTDLYIGVSSMYLLVAQQMGLLGATAFGLVFVVMFASAVRAWPRVRCNEALTPIWLGAHAGIAGALLSGVFDHYFFNIDFHVSVMLFWSVVALALAAGAPTPSS
jgi:hypothetical protein